MELTYYCYNKGHTYVLNETCKYCNLDLSLIYSQEKKTSSNIYLSESERLGLFFRIVF